MAGDFAYLIRFLDNEGKECYGNLTEAKTALDLIGSKAQVVLGNPLVGLTVTDEEKTISKFTVPSQPVVFTKPADSIAAPFDDIHVHPEAQSQLDYEGELCFIFGKDCKDVTEGDAMDCVLGYTIGNDFSARNYIPQEISGFQMSYGKSFDAFAPFGPYIVHPRIVGDPHQLQLTTKVNGEIRQNEKTSDMIWKIPGTVCMTGTPSGVGWFMQPTGYVKHGDEVEVTIEKLGSIKNRVFFL
ncbi:fumarylacetoacetate hydrolase family protein [Dactylonectria estremocensis]|uniref:Fumarylacetoacetate hydrolase family protein n=1 Tax=Dactylonectria estremocensis TaxID=1079267 RepID=A0A9P9ESY3_9HYPO|nr:fumarylacetoacetate hydrolase family protein [Dactylonectria estremocensis]